LIGDWIDKVEYPQLPAMTEEELVSFFDQEQFARLGTFNEDGTIHIAPIFFEYVDAQILMATQATSRKIRNIKRNKNVTVLIDNTTVPFKGALVYGTSVCMPWLHTSFWTPDCHKWTRLDCFFPWRVC